MRKSWYRRLLFSYFPIFMLTVSILIFLSFLIVNEISRNETSKANRITTGFVMDSVENSLTKVEMDVLSEAETNKSYSTFLNGQAQSGSMMLYELVGSLRTLKDNHELVHSIYIYRTKDHKVLTMSGLQEASTFADYSYIEQALRSEDRQWSPVREWKEPGQHTSERVISMHKRLPLPFGGQGLLVINIGVYPLEQVIAQMTNPAVSYLLINDGSGHTIYPAVSDTKDAVKAEDGQQLTQLLSPRLGWSFESGIRAGQLFEWVSVISYVWIAVGLAVVILAVVYIIYVTHRNYRPIQLMMQRIQQLPGRPGEENNKDELWMIDHALQSLIRQTVDYEQQEHANILIRRRQLFLDLMEGTAAETVEFRLDHLSPFADGGKREASPIYTVMVVELHDLDLPQTADGKSTGSGHSEEHGDEDQRLSLSLLGVIQELAATYGWQGWAEWMSRERISILLRKEESVGEGLLGVKLQEMAQTGCEWLQGHLGVQLTIGIGSQTYELEHIQDSYRAAVSALRYRLTLGVRDIVTSDQVPQANEIPLYSYLPLISETIRSFRLANHDWRIQLEGLFGAMEADKLKDGDILTVVRWLQELLEREMREMKDVSGALDRYFNGAEGQRWKAEVESASSLAMMHTLMLERMTTVYRTYVAASETKSYRAMVSEMKQYIEEHYTNPDLSLNHLSERFDVSPKYASHLFKTEFDMKFVDFLTRLRMNHAQQMLCNTTETVQHIATQVGYANSITFGRVFKRVVGVTPGDYRKLRLKPGDSIAGGAL
ncbi:AraC family transcriptional regulator [Paenibacillus kribbensis]|uniref:AraC family transcriptional regulator n=1 Tax=Paenibacillus kribbensis TaxID=172713 RepID=A0A222WQS4_9BACL|nr:AraC family transcriptional regulator [Paenibacillus kribbensis]ASR48073.1 AraC family transcriptional regulator [Paenibacillus kribbensis]